MTQDEIDQQSDDLIVKLKPLLEGYDPRAILGTLYALEASFLGMCPALRGYAAKFREDIRRAADEFPPTRVFRFPLDEGDN